MSLPSKDNIITFMKSHRPVAPEAPRNELQRLLNKIADKEFQQRRPFMSWWRIAVPVAVAACLTLFVVADFTAQRTTFTGPADNIALEEFIQETYAVLDNGNADITIGSDWLLLVP